MPTAPSAPRSRCIEAGRGIRAAPPAPDLPPIGCTRVGLHHGEAVVGNFGGEGRIQYTALGDGMNTAARLEIGQQGAEDDDPGQQRGEGPGSTLDMLPADGPDRAQRPGDAGRGVGAGAATWTRELRARLNALWLRFDGGDPEALVQLEEIAAGDKDDAALQEFIYRIREAGPGGHFVLGSK